MLIFLSGVLLEPNVGDATSVSTGIEKAIGTKKYRETDDITPVVFEPNGE